MTAQPGEKDWDRQSPTSGDDITTGSASDPHSVIFHIEDHKNKVLCDAADGKPIKWFRSFPTRDSAYEFKREIMDLSRKLKGEPEQAWSDISAKVKCPNPSLLPQYRNIQMEIRPTPQKQDPRLHGFVSTLQRTASDGPKDADRAGTGAGSKPADAGKPGRTRVRTPKRKAPVQGAGRNKKAASKAKSKSPLRGKRRGPKGSGSKA